LCADQQISKKLSAPRLNLHTSRQSKSASNKVDAASQTEVNETSIIETPTSHDPADARQLQAAWLKVARHVMENTHDVGEQFAEQARKMHYGETEHRNIRGVATPEQTQELLEEGVAVLPLPIPQALKEPLQ
jgi:hypothetical protein